MVSSIGRMMMQSKRGFFFFFLLEDSFWVPLVFSLKKSFLKMPFSSKWMILHSFITLVKDEATRGRLMVLF